MKEASGATSESWQKEHGLIAIQITNYKILSGKAPVRRGHTLPTEQKPRSRSASEPGHQLTKIELKRGRGRRTAQLIHPPRKRSHAGRMCGRGEEA